MVGNKNKLYLSPDYLSVTTEKKPLLAHVQDFRKRTM